MSSIISNFSSSGFEFVQLDKHFLHTGSFKNGIWVHYLQTTFSNLMKQNYVCLKYKLNEYEKMNDFSYIIGF